MENFPRRNRLDLNTKAELSIHESIQEIENIGADEKLTKAINLLSEAKNLVSDYIDKNDPSICDICGCYYEKLEIGTTTHSVCMNKICTNYRLSTNYKII